jgi:hypothetical protein
VLKTNANEKSYKLSAIDVLSHFLPLNLNEKCFRLPVFIYSKKPLPLTPSPRAGREEITSRREHNTTLPFSLKISSDKI